MGVQNFLEQNFGLLEKAVIDIVDARGRKQKTEALAAPKGGKVDPILGDAADKILKAAAIAEAVAALLGFTASSGQKLEDFFKDVTIKRYTVQFNPSSLSLHATAPGFDEKATYQGTQKSVSTPSQSVNITMSVKLVVDQVYNATSFIEDRMNISPTQLAQNLAHMFKGNKPTVQQTVEGFIAAIRDKSTRVVIFRWGEMTYSGTLKSVSAQYVMFDSYGEPVRAYIDLSLTCLHGDESNTLGYWEKAYKDAFS